MRKKELEKLGEIAAFGKKGEVPVKKDMDGPGYRLLFYSYYLFLIKYTYSCIREELIKSSIHTYGCTVESP